MHSGGGALRGGGRGGRDGPPDYGGVARQPASPRGSNRRPRPHRCAPQHHDRAHRSRSHPARIAHRRWTPRPRVVSWARRAGYQLLGPRLDYLLHTRPAEWPILAAHTAVGYLLAVGLRSAAQGERLAPALMGI